MTTMSISIWCTEYQWEGDKGYSSTPATDLVLVFGFLFLFCTHSFNIYSFLSPELSIKPAHRKCIITHVEYVSG